MCPIFRNEENLPFHCDKCDKRFPTELKLSNHTKYKSKTCPRYKCEECEERFCTNVKFEEHRLKHNNENNEIGNQIVPDLGEENVDSPPFEYSDEEENVTTEQERQETTDNEFNSSLEEQNLAEHVRT